MGRAKFSDEHRTPKQSGAARIARVKARDAQREAEMARWTGYGDDVRRMRRAASVTDTGGGTSVRKPDGVKLGDGTRRYNDDGITSGKPDIAQGTFVQYGARTKEGKLSLKNRNGSQDKRKAWKCNYQTTRQSSGRGTMVYGD